MAIRDFAAVLRRHPWVTLAVAVLTALPVLRAQTAPPRYEARSVVTFLSPKAPFPRNAFASFTPALVTMAEVSSRWLASEAARGRVRAAGGTADFQVVLANRGNQELPVHDQPNLTVIVTAKDAGRTRATLLAVLAVLRDRLRAQQAADGARPGSLISWQVTAGSDRAVPVSGRPSRAVLALLVLGALATILAAVTADRRRRWADAPARAAAPAPPA